MIKKRIVLTFPQNLVEQPITYHLIKDYDLMVNILSAKVKPNEEGRLVIEVSGKRDAVNRGLNYLKELGVKLQPLAQDVKWYEDKCTHCTACVAICPSGALSVVERIEMKVSFNLERCIVCGLCLKACPYQAVEILF